MSVFSRLLNRHGSWSRVMTAGMLSAGLLAASATTALAQLPIAPTAASAPAPARSTSPSTLPALGDAPTRSEPPKLVTTQTPGTPGNAGTSSPAPAVSSPTLSPVPATSSSNMLMPSSPAMNSSPSMGSPGGGDGGAGLSSSSVPAPGGSGDAPSPDQALPLTAQYRHNFAGGYLHFETTGCDADTFVMNFQNQVTIDGTYYNLANAPTIFNGFYMPFTRSFIYGNFLKDWEYQVSTQFFVDRFNILDMFGGYKFNDEVNVRFGHMLSPFLYEWYAFSPAWEPVITNSLNFNLAGRRQTGAMLWGQLFEKTVQYQGGVFNGYDGGYFDLDKNVDFLGSIAFNPFKNDTGSALRYFGFGVSAQTGRQDYALDDPRTASAAWSNGEPTTHQTYRGSSGIAFLSYLPGVRANGMRSKVAPNLYWYGQFSFQAEYVYWNRALSNAANPQVNEVIHGTQVTASYLLTGESHTGDGLLGWAVITPNDPFIPSRGLYGTGAWELSAQYSQMQVSSNVVNAGLTAPGVSATRIDQVLAGVNWWPNKYTRLSLDYMYDKTNAPVDMGGGNFKTDYSTYWTRLAMFF